MPTGTKVEPQETNFCEIKIKKEDFDFKKVQMLSAKCQPCSGLSILDVWEASVWDRELCGGTTFN